jgi:hypothetical protein
MNRTWLGKDDAPARHQGASTSRSEAGSGLSQSVRTDENGVDVQDGRYVAAPGPIEG